MDYIAPGADYTSRFSAGVANTGLVGTIRFRLIDADSVADDPVYGPSTAGIVEDPTGSGDYMVTITAPSSEGKFYPAWDLGSGQLFYDEDIQVTRTAVGPLTPSGHEYVTRDELKGTLEIAGSDDQYDADIDIAVEAASRAIDGYKRTRFYPTSETRYYSPDHYDTDLRIQDLNTLTSLTCDFDSDGTYEVTLVEGTDFDLLPLNHALDGVPADRVALRPSCAWRWPRGPKSVKIIGSFGWLITPANVHKAAGILATRLFKRSRETPYAIMSVIATDVVAAARLGKIDPDLVFLLDNLPGAQAPPLQSLQLS